ncbi:hypothetical protein [Nitrosarchaeum sp.]|uniref:hypothetical protein n=1 Tax=Nitrosarchaeum sp. TaxID=2026886 RepID=UPI00247BE9A3|nr:hypothetical protein [Nitrosarchaeum sp.]MCV0412934.1 hypothetical protein [Nitrosarchaeum sp.]
MKRVLVIVPIVITVIAVGIIFIVDSEKFQCLLKGGIMLQGLSSKPWCNLPTSDAGKECTDLSQCQGYCKPNNESELNNEIIGICSEYMTSVGCFEWIYNGTIEKICAD